MKIIKNGSFYMIIGGAIFSWLYCTMYVLQKHRLYAYKKYVKILIFNKNIKNKENILWLFKEDDRLNIIKKLKN